MSFEIQVDVPVPSTRPPAGAKTDLVTGPVWLRATGVNIPGGLWLEFEWHDNRWTCRRLRVESEEELSSTLLRRIPLTAIIEAGARQLDDRNVEVMKRRMLSDGFTKRDLELLETKVKTRRGRRSGPEGPTAEELERFATTYRFALWMRARNPIATTMEHLEDQGLKVSRATANRWRDLCLRANPPLLPPLDKPAWSAPAADANDD